MRKGAGGGSNDGSGGGGDSIGGSIGGGIGNSISGSIGGVIKSSIGNGRGAEDGDLAGLFSSGSLFGTALYLSPEQVRGDTSANAHTDTNTDASTGAGAGGDVWGAGAVAFEALAGGRPFVGETLVRLGTLLGRRVCQWSISLCVCVLVMTCCMLYTVMSTEHAMAVCVYS